MATTNNKGIAVGILAALGLYMLTRKTAPNYVDDDTVPDLGPDDAPTLTKAEAQQIADGIAAAIYADSMFWGWGFGALGENEGRIVRLLTQPSVATTGDVLLIAECYGVRGEAFTPDYTLFQALGAYLSTGNVDQIASTWRERGINIEPR